MLEGFLSRFLALVLAIIVLTGAKDGLAQTLPPFSPSGPNATGLIALPGLNEAQQMMAQSINNVCPTINSIATPTIAQRDLGNVCSAMLGSALQVQGQPTQGLPSFGIGSDTLAGALENLNGGTQIVAPTSQSSSLQIQQSGLVGEVVEGRLSRLRKPLSDLQMAAVPQLRPLLAQAPSPYASDAAPNLGRSQPVTLNYQSNRLGVYLNGIGQFGDHDLTSRQNGYSFSNAGFIAGADYRFTPEFAAGAAFSYTRANTDFDTSAVSPSGQTIRSDLYQGTLYGTYSVNERLFVNGTAIIGGGDTDSRRHIVIPSTTAVAAVDRFTNGSFGLDNHSLNIGAGYTVPIDRLVLTPTARVQYLHASSDGFSERGASGLDLTYGRSSHDSYLSYIGAHAQYSIPTTLGPLYATGYAEWAHQFNSANAAVPVSYANDPFALSSFVMPADKVTKNYVNLGVGMTLQFSPSQSVFFAYDTVLGLSNTTYNSFTAGLRLTF